MDIELTETNNSSSTSTRVVISPINKGATGWREYTYYYNYNISTGQWYTVNYGEYPNQNYQSGSAVINVYYVQDNPSWKIQNTIMHEMGYIFGLMHSSVSGALMSASSASYTSIKLPQADNKNGVRAIYR